MRQAARTTPQQLARTGVAFLDDAPAGADLPDTRNALKIPDLEKPELPRESGSCLEHPPPYGGESTQPAQG